MYQLNPLLESTKWKTMLRKGQLSDEALKKLRSSGVYDPYKFLRGKLKGQQKRIDALHLPSQPKITTNAGYYDSFAQIPGNFHGLGPNGQVMYRNGHLSFPGVGVSSRKINHGINFQNGYEIPLMSKAERAVIQNHEMEEFIRGIQYNKDPNIMKIKERFIKRKMSIGIDRDTASKMFDSKWNRLSGTQLKDINLGHQPGVLQDELAFRNQIKPLLQRTGDPTTGLGHYRYTSDPELRRFTVKKPNIWKRMMGVKGELDPRVLSEPIAYSRTPQEVALAKTPVKQQMKKIYSQLSN